MNFYVNCKISIKAVKLTINQENLQWSSIEILLLLLIMFTILIFWESDFKLIK